MTPFKQICNLSGLYSVQEAADFLQIRTATCRQYWYAEHEIPSGIIEELFEECVYKLKVDGEIKEMTKEELVEFFRRET